MVFESTMPLLIVAWLLLVYGLLALFSVGVHESFVKTLGWIAQGKMSWEASNYYYFFEQLKNLVYIIIAGYLTYLIPLKTYKHKKILIGLLVAVFILQLLVFTPRGENYNWSTGWLNIPWLPIIQPVEFFKVGYVFFMAWRFVRKQHLLDSFSLLWKFFILNAVIFLFLAFIPDFWTVLILAPVGVIIWLYAGINWKNMLAMLGIGLGWLILMLGWFVGINRSYCRDVPKDSQPHICRYSYIANRVEVYIDPEADEDGYNASWQIRNALIAIGWWGFTGRGYGKWLQKFWYIPEAQSDFIFAAYAEEVWFVGILVLFGLYGSLIYVVLSRVPKVRDPFFKYVAIGLVSLLIVGAFVHIGVNIHLLPNTWVTLPFVSSGWSSLMISVLSIVLLYKILYQHPERIY